MYLGMCAFELESSPILAVIYHWNTIRLSLNIKRLSPYIVVGRQEKGARAKEEGLLKYCLQDYLLGIQVIARHIVQKESILNRLKDAITINYAEENENIFEENWFWLGVVVAVFFLCSLVDEKEEQCLTHRTCIVHSTRVLGCVETVSAKEERERGRVPAHLSHPVFNNLEWWFMVLLAFHFRRIDNMRVPESAVSEERLLL